MCNKDCIYRDTGTECACEENGWQEDSNHQSKEEDDLDVKIGTPDPENVEQ